MCPHFREFSSGQEEFQCTNIHTLWSSFDFKLRGMRERSPPLTKIMHPSHPVWAIASFNKAKCNAESPPGGTACLITVSPVPGKLTATLYCPAYIPNLTTNSCGLRYSLFTIFTNQIQMNICVQHSTIVMPDATYLMF